MMDTRKLVRTTTTVLLALGLIASAAYARGRGGRGGPPGEDGFRRGPRGVLAQLDLNAEQKEALRVLRRQHRREMADMHSDLAEARAALLGLAEQDDATFEDVEAAEDVMFAAKRAMRRLRRAHRAAMMELLTPEQAAKVPNAWRLGLDRPHGRRGGPGWHQGRAGRGRGGPGGVEHRGDRGGFGPGAPGGPAGCTGDGPCGGGPAGCTGDGPCGGEFWAPED